jgi:hypothetical protein
VNRPLALVAALVLAASGCGGGESRVADPTPQTTKPAEKATRPATPKVRVKCHLSHAARYRACERVARARWSHSTLELRVAPGRWRVIAYEPKGAMVARMAAGWWRDAWLSPDGSMLLAQWSGECEVPVAFFVPAGGGPMRAVTGHRDVRNAPQSEALGWMPDGRARVRLPDGVCSAGTHPPGIYAIDPNGGEPTLLKEIPPR